MAAGAQTYFTFDALIGVFFLGSAIGVQDQVREQQAASSLEPHLNQLEHSLYPATLGGLMTGGVMVMVVSSSTGFNSVFNDEDNDPEDNRIMYNFQFGVVLLLVATVVLQSVHTFFAFKPLHESSKRIYKIFKAFDRRQAKMDRLEQMKTRLFDDSSLVPLSALTTMLEQQSPNIASFHVCLQ